MDGQLATGQEANSPENEVLLTRKEESMPKSPLYTSHGDYGLTSLYNGERKHKRDIVFKVLGTIDELNSNVGMAKELCLAERKALPDDLKESKEGQDFLTLVEFLEWVQMRLLDAGSHCATPLTSSSSVLLERVKFPEDSLKTIEKYVDELDYQLPRLHSFILPGGGIAACQMHICRTISRKCERYLVGLIEQDNIDPVVFKFMNRYYRLLFIFSLGIRMSDFFYASARFVCKTMKREEVLYRKSEGVRRRSMDERW